MGCICVCAAGAGALDGVAAVALMALGFAVAAAVAVAVVSVVAGFAWVLAVAVAVANVAAIWLLVRVWKHGPTLEVFRRHRRPAERPAALPAAPRQAALPVGSALMLEQAQPKTIRGTVLDDVYEKLEAR